MKNFNEYYKERSLERELSEDAASAIGLILGYASLTLITAFGGSLLILGGAKSVTLLIRLWRRIFKVAKDIKKDPRTIVRSVKLDSKVQKEKVKTERITDKYRDDIKEVLAGIRDKDFNRAKDEYNNLERFYKNLPEVHRIIIYETTKAIGEPPLYIANRGNVTYLALKKILGIRIARAAAEATKMALEKEVKE